MAHIRKRGESYEITVSCGYNSYGKKIRKSMTYTPSPNMSDRQIKKEVNRQAVLFEESCKNGTAASGGKIKFDDFVKQFYLINAKDFLSELDFNYYKSILKNHISPVLGHMKLKEIKPIHVQEFVNIIKEKPSNKSKSGKLAATSVRRYFTVLQSVMHHAYKLGLIGINPASSDRITLPRIEEPTTEILTKEELDIIFNLLNDEQLMFKLLIHIAINSGCRRGELVGLQWSDVDFKTGVITIQRSNYKVKNGPIRSKEPKNKKKRFVTLPPYCMELLKEYRKKQNVLQFELGDAWCGNNWIFIQADGKPMNPTTPTQWFSKFLKKHNLKHIKFHALRHTSATLLLANGTNIKNVASRLGHAQLKTTNRYVHALDAADMEAANKFEELFNPNSKKE